MCFTPKVSLITAIIEFVTTGYILLKFHKSIFARFIALFIFVLGFYQFTEYMLCTTNNIELWGKLGFVSYTILPAMGIHFLLFFKVKPTKLLLIYIPVVFYVIYAIFDTNFVTRGSCQSYFVNVENALDYTARPWFTLIYEAYYFVSIVFICTYSLISYLKERQQQLINFYLTILITTLITVIPPFLLTIVIPSQDKYFPSIYCQFALLYTIMAIIIVRIESKLSTNNKST